MCALTVCDQSDDIKIGENKMLYIQISVFYFYTEMLSFN